MSSINKQKQLTLKKQFTSLMRGYGARTILHQQNVATSLGVSNNDFISIDILRETGPITAGELASKTSLSTGTITALIDRLEKIGYVRREKDPKDRRRVMIVPTYEHKEEIKEIYSSLNQSMLNLANQYSQEELTLINNFLAASSQILDEEIQSFSNTKKE